MISQGIKILSKFWPFILITAIVLLFFYPVFKGQLPFPGDLLVSTNPYRSQSFLGIAAGGYPNKAQGQDVIAEIYPWRNFSINQLKQGSIPFWNPYNFSGNPQIANFQTAVFYPLNFFYFLLPFNLAWTLIIMSQPLLAALFMYWFLKKGIGIKNFPAVIGGIAFGFSSHMVVWIEYGNIGSTFLWLPLILLLTKYLAQKIQLKIMLVLVLSLTIAILAGYIQGVFYIYALCFFYYLYLVLMQKKFKQFRSHILFLVSLGIPLLLSSFQILPTLQLFAESTRSAYTLAQIGKNLAPIQYLITIAIPDFFGNPATRNYWIDGTYIERVMYPGVVMLLFAAYAILSRVKFVEKKFFLIVAAVSLLIATNFPLVKYFYLIPIPVISTTVPTRELCIFIFSMIVLGAIGLEHFLTEKSFQKKFIFIFLAFLISVWGAVISLIKFYPALSVNLKITEHNLIIPSLLIIATIVAILFKKINLKISLILLTILVVFDLFYFFNKITPFSPSVLAYPQTPVISYLQNNAGINRYWGYGSAYIQANYESMDQTFSPEGNDPLHISRYGELIASSKDGIFPKTPPRPDANIAPGYGVNDLKTNRFRQRILDLFGVKYVLNYQELNDAWQNADLSTFPPEDFFLVYKVFPWQVYENKNALPRFFLANNFIIANNKQRALDEIYNPKLDLRKTLILESNPNLLIDSNAKGDIKLISYKPNNVIFETTTNGNSLLFLSDNYFPDWGVKIDGNDSKILIADYSFRAVAIPKGKHVVEFYYSPKIFELGLGIGAAGLLLLILVAVYVKKNKS
jgi:uncharacterized membrane protein YfhO